MDGLVKTFTTLPKAKNDDDFTDRVSSRYTVAIIITFAVLVGLSQIVGGAIFCWAPVHFTGSHKKYTNNYCWVRNTYYLPWDQRIPPEGADRDYITYYQWVPLILLVQAALFYFPSVIWHGLNQKSGVDADNILASAGKFNTSSNIANKSTTLQVMTNQFDRFLGGSGTRDKAGQESSLNKMSSIISKASCNMCGTRFGSYLVCLYLVTKLLYIGNVILQLFLLNILLDTNYMFYGVEVLKWLIHDDVNQWTSSPYVAFPRVTLCDFRVRRLGNVHRYTVQCTLPINLYNEKIYMFLWFWMVFVATVTVISFIQWLLRAISASDRKTYIKNHVKAGQAYEIDNKEQRMDKFVNNYLRLDGVFLLRLIGHNTNNITVTEIIVALWNNWNEKENKNLDDNANQDPKAIDDVDSGAEPSAPALPEKQPLMDQ